MVKIQFHKIDNGRGDEDWYYFMEESDGNSVFILHEWLHGAPHHIKTGEKTYTIEEFEKDMPNQYQYYLEWREK